MAVFKRKRRVKLASGKTAVRQSSKWYVKYRDADGIVRCVPGYTDKEASKQLETRLLKEAALAKEGVVDRYKEHRQRPLTEHLEDFKQSLLAKGDTIKHAKQIASRVRLIVEGCKLRTWTDIQPSKVQRYLADLRYKGEPISAQTFNFYLKAMQQFCRWLVRDGRASESPVEHLKCKTVRKGTDEVHPRRVLEIDELRRLLEVTKAGPKRFGMSGYERYLLYRLTAETGLRAEELRSLKVCSFDFDNLTVHVSGVYTKNRREAVQPVRPDTAKELKAFFSDKMPNVKAFGGTYKKLTDKTSKVLKADLADAGIPYVVDGFYFDFHALRHQTGTLLAASGVHPKVAQTIMRHADINLTLSRYTHTLTGQEAEAVAGLPDLGAPQHRKNAATGTDGRARDSVQSDSQELTPQWTPELTLTAYPVCNQSAADVNSQSPKPTKADSHKSLQTGELGNESEGVSSSVTDKEKIRLEGFEPPAFGSVDRRSIQLSYRRRVS